MRAKMIGAALLTSLAAGAIATPTLAQGYGYYGDYGRGDACYSRHDNGTAGAVVGGLLGAMLGSSLAPHHANRAGGAAIGAVAGALVGNSVARSGSADCGDDNAYAQPYQSYGYAQPYQSYRYAQPYRTKVYVYGRGGYDRDAYRNWGDDQDGRWSDERSDRGDYDRDWRDDRSGRYGYGW